MNPKTLEIRLAAVKKKVPLINLFSTETPQLMITNICDSFPCYTQYTLIENSKIIYYPEIFIAL